MTIRYIDNTTAQVTKAFAKKAVIFGTEEYKLWREYLKDFPSAQMVTKTIKKKDDKKSTKNMTYENMETYISIQKDAKKLLEEYKKQKQLSKIQTSPYHYMVEWFKNTFENYAEAFKEKNTATEEKSNVTPMNTAKAC